MKSKKSVELAHLEINIIFAFIYEEHLVGYCSLSVLCRTLKVLRTTYYRWLQHTPTAREMETKALEKRICSIKRVQKIMLRLVSISYHGAKYKPPPSHQK